MLNFIQNFLLFITGLIFFLRWLSLSSGWKELSKKYKTEKCSPDTFIIVQQGVFVHNTRNTMISSNTVIRPLGIGVSDEGLYLSESYPMDIFFPPLLIPWNEIIYRKVIENFRGKYFIFYLGNSQITSLKLASSVVKKLEQSYGEPIFKNRLGDPN